MKVNVNEYFGKSVLFSDGIERECNVVAILTHADGTETAILGANIVTDAGDRYYAEKACGQTPNKDFAAGGMRLGTGSTAPAKADADVTTFVAGSGKAVDATYPKTGDADTDNTGAGLDIVTWRVSYATTEANSAGINEGAVVDNITTPTAAHCHWLFAASFTKTSTDTLKVFVNHQFNGV